MTIQTYKGWLVDMEVEYVKKADHLAVLAEKDKQIEHRFEKTVDDLQDCYEHMDDVDLSTYEIAARQRLIRICIDIVTDFGDENG